MNEGTRLGKSTIRLQSISAVRPTNGLYLYLLPMELILNKRDMCLPHVSSIFKKISPKSFGHHCMYVLMSSTKVHVIPVRFFNFIIFRNIFEKPKMSMS
jgi:hypothetical protein